MIHHVCGEPTCSEVGHVYLTSIPTGPLPFDPEKARTHWQFGDVIKVDPKARFLGIRPIAGEVDERRWLVLQVAQTSANRQWVLLCLNPGVAFGTTSHWSSMHGFVRVEE